MVVGGAAAAQRHLRLYVECHFKAEQGRRASPARSRMVHPPSVFSIRAGRDKSPHRSMGTAHQDSGVNGITWRMLREATRTGASIEASVGRCQLASKGTRRERDIERGQRAGSG
jgi:hypothetical protein